MKPFIAVYIVALTCGLTHSYSAYGNKRYNRANVVDPMMQVYTQPAQPQYYEKTANTNYLQSQPQYLSVPYTQQRSAEDYNVNSNRNPNPNYYYYPRQDYQSPLFGVPTYRGDYQPKPYYFAQPSYSSSDDHIETTNPLDYLHEEILQENERERSLNNAAFMQNLALYNKQVDSLHSRQQQLQQLQELYNLKSSNDPEDYDLEQPSDWYDQTSILVDPNTFDGYNGDYQMMPQVPSNQYQYPSRPSDYDDEMVKELRDLTKQNQKSSGTKDYASPSMKEAYNNIDWQQDMPQENDDVIEAEYDDEDDSWINWGQKRNIQPKKDNGLVDSKQTQQTVNKLPISKKPTVSTQTPITSVTENSKLIAKLHRGQKEVVLPRPATPVRKPFTEPIMKMMKANKNVDGKPSKSEPTPPIYKTIKQIIDMEQNLSHVSTFSHSFSIKQLHLNIA